MKKSNSELSNAGDMFLLLEKTCSYAEHWVHDSENYSRLLEYLNKFRNLPPESLLDQKEKEEILELNSYVNQRAAGNKIAYDETHRSGYDYFQDECGGQGLHM